MRKTGKGSGHAVSLAVMIASAGWSACVGDDAGRRDVSETDGAAGDSTAEVTSEVTRADGGSDTIDEEAGPIVPPGTTLIEGTVVPPGGASPAGWRVVNRYGEASIGPEGTFVLPVADLEGTLTIAVPPEQPRAPLALLTARSEASVGAPGPLRIDVASTAIAALMIHPRVTPRASWRLVPLAEIAADLGSTRVLAQAIATSFDVGWAGDAGTREAYRGALDALLRRVSPPWDATLATDVPRDPAGVESVRRDVPLATITRTGGGALSFVPIAGRPPALVATIEALDAGTVGRWDVLAGDVPAAVGAAWSSDGPVALDEGLYRVTLEADAAACEALAAEAVAGLVDVGQDTFRMPARGLADAMAEVEPEVALVADPDHPLAALIDARRGPSRETMIVIVGDPFTPRFDGAGRHLDRLVVKDAAGRRRAPRMSGGQPTAPAGLAGTLTLVAESAGGLAERAFGVAPVVVTRVTPSRIAAASGLVRVEVDGAGFEPGGEVDLGATTVTVPAEATPERFGVTLDASGMSPGAAGVALRVVGAPVIEGGPEVVPGGASAVFATQDATDDLVVSTLLAGVSSPLPVRLITDALIVIDTSPLPQGTHTLRFDNAAGRTQRALTVVRPAPAYARDIRFAATDLVDRQVYLSTALEIANGQTIAHGEFWRYDTLILGADDWYCPLDIRPETAVIARPCTHWSGVCPDLWAWADTRDPASWFTVTPPPGRKTTGAEHCPPVAGPASWSDVTRRELADRVETSDAVYLQGQVLRGPNATLVLPAARNGGLTVAAPRVEVAGPDARNDVVLDLVIDDATATNDRPVVTLDGATGVRIRRLEIRGRPGGCAVGLRVKQSRDVVIEALAVRDCDVGVEVTGSADVRIGAAPTLAAPWPITIAGARTGLRIDTSEDVYAHVAIGIRPGEPSVIVAGGAAAAQQDGVVIETSERVAIGGTVVATSGAAVRLTSVRHARVGPLAVGFVKTLDDTTIAAGASVGTGLVIEGGSAGADDVIVTDARIDQTTGDAIVTRGGSRVRIARSRIGDVVGAVGGAGLRAALGYAHDLDVDGLDVRGVKAVGVHVAGGGRVDLRRATIVTGGGAACALNVASAQGVRVTGATLVGHLCASLTTDLRVVDVDVDELRLVGSADVHVERARAARVVIDGSVGIVLKDLDAGSVAVTGPVVVHDDPIALVGGVLHAEVDALTVIDSKVPVVIDELTAASVRAERHAGVRVVSGSIGRVTTAGVGALVVNGEVDGVESEGEVIIEGGRVDTIVARDGRLALVDADVGSIAASDTEVVVAGSRVEAIGATRGALTVRDVTIARSLSVTDVDGASVAELDGSAGIVLDGGVGARLARVSGAIERRGAAREVRVVDAPGLVDAKGDPAAHGHVSGGSIVVTAAPEHALVELLGEGGVVARAFTSAGRVVFPGFGAGAWRLVATLLDGSSGAAIALVDVGGPMLCAAPEAPETLVDRVMGDTPSACDGAPADVVPSPDCRTGARIVGGGLVIVDLASGAEDEPDAGAQARWPAWEADGTALWLSRRERDDAPWSLARFELDNARMEVVLALAEDLAWPAPSPRGPLVAVARCAGRDPEGEPEACHVVFLDPRTGALGAPAQGGWPAAVACDERRPRWLGIDAVAPLGDGVIVERRPMVGGAASLDVVSPLGLARWRLGPASDQPGR